MHKLEEPYDGRLSRPVACPAKAGVFRGIKPSRVKVGSPLAWVAAMEEMNPLKPTDNVFFKEDCELSGCNENERIGSFESEKTQVVEPVTVG